MEQDQRPNGVNFEVFADFLSWRLEHGGDDVEETSIGKQDVYVCDAMLAGEFCDGGGGITVHSGVDLDNNDFAAFADWYQFEGFSSGGYISDSCHNSGIGANRDSFKKTSADTTVGTCDDICESRHDF